MIKKIDHIAIAVKDLDSEIIKYRDIFGLKFTGEEVVEEQMVRVGFFEVGQIHLELMEPTSEKSPIYSFLEKRGEGFHHVAYEVDDLHKDLSVFNNQDIRVLDEQPRKGSRESLIAFIHPKSVSGVLVELVQKKTD